MEKFVCVVCVLFLPVFSSSRKFQPKVQVYTHSMAELGKANFLICHASNFHPPEIAIELLKNGEPMLGDNQTALTFDEDWHYHLTKSIPLTPEGGVEYACKVTHMGKPKMFVLENDF